MAGAGAGAGGGSGGGSSSSGSNSSSSGSKSSSNSNTNQSTMGAKPPKGDLKKAGEKAQDVKFKEKTTKPTKSEKEAKAKADNYGVDLKFINKIDRPEEKQPSSLPFNKVEKIYEKDLEAKNKSIFDKVKEVINQDDKKLKADLDPALVNQESAYNREKLREKLSKSDVLAAATLHTLATDKGNELHTQSDKKEVAQSIAEVAHGKGWTEINVTGTKDFKREVWIEGTARGLKVEGYEATKEDKLQADKRTKEIEVKYEINSVKPTTPYEAGKDFEKKTNSNVIDIQQKIDAQNNMSKQAKQPTVNNNDMGKTSVPKEPVQKVDANQSVYAPKGMKAVEVTRTNNTEPVQKSGKSYGR